MMFYGVLALTLNLAFVSPKPNIFNKPDLLKTEKETLISCRCGLTGKNFSIALQRCTVINKSTGEKTYEFCKKEYFSSNPCEEFKNCASCKDGYLKCITCPPEKKGRYCNEDTPSWLPQTPPSNRSRRSREDNWFYDQRSEGIVIVIPPKPISDRIMRKRQISHSDYMTPPDHAEDNGNQYLDDKKSPADSDDAKKYQGTGNTPCPLPAPMRTNEITCTLYPSSMTCVQQCVYGFTFEGTDHRSAHCEAEEGNWSPDAFMECKPFVNCVVILKEPGDLHCYLNRLNVKSRCEIVCLGGGDHKEAPKRSYDCNLDRTWSPSLPYCVEQDNDAELVDPPKRGGRH